MKTKKIVGLLIFSSLILSFCIYNSEREKYKLLLISEVYLDKGEDINNKGEKEVTNYLGLFSKDNDTVTVYKFNEDLSEKLNTYSFWSEKKRNKIIFHNSESNKNICVMFNQQNVIINDDIYKVNQEYYNFLKQKIFNEGSILDLAFFSKDGYGDYKEFLEPLNKNWRNQKEIANHRILSVEFKNKNYQTDTQFFNYKIKYSYNKNGRLQNVSGGNYYSKNFVKENNKYIVYKINRNINERSVQNEYLYKNKKSLFDSIVGYREIYSKATTYYYVNYQSKLKIYSFNKKIKNIEEIIEDLKI